MPDEERLTEDIIELTRQLGRYGCRMITGMLNDAGWHVNHKRVGRRAVVRHWSEDNGARRRDGEGPGKAPVGRFPDDT